MSRRISLKSSDDCIRGAAMAETSIVRQYQYPFWIIHKGVS
jgi:hypothetical protein